VAAAAQQGHCANDRYRRRHAWHLAGGVDDCRIDAAPCRGADDAERGRTGNSVADVVDSGAHTGGFDQHGNDDGHASAERQRGQQCAQRVPADGAEVDDPHNAQRRGYPRLRHCHGDVIG